jgi:arginine:ornithine antiporter/lysine permease
MEKKLGLSALTALVLSSMLGAGVFSLPQNMAAVASPSALIIGWGITGVGILLLAFAMLLLTAFARIWTAAFSPMRVKVSAS